MRCVGPAAVEPGSLGRRADQLNRPGPLLGEAEHDGVGQVGGEPVRMQGVGAVGSGRLEVGPEAVDPTEQLGAHRRAPGHPPGPQHERGPSEQDREGR